MNIGTAQFATGVAVKVFDEFLKELQVKKSLNHLLIEKSFHIIEGNDDSSNGFMMYVATRTIIRQNVILKDNRMSRSTVGNGITMNTRIPTIATAKKTSLFFRNLGRCIGV